MTEKTMTMYDYILEQRPVLLNIIDKRDTIVTELKVALQARKPAIAEIIICGSGTSLHAGIAMKKFMEDIIGVNVRVEYPMFFKDLSKVFYGENTIFIGVSQSGGSRSTIEALEKAKAAGALTIAVSEGEAPKIFKNADVKVQMSCGPEYCVAKTKGYLASMAILALIAMEIALAKNTIDEKGCASYLEAMASSFERIDELITKSTAWVESLKEELIASRRMIVLGYENNYATVLEGALKLLETLRYGVSGYEMEEFCHGIYNSIKPDCYILYLASAGQYKKRAFQLKNILAEITDKQYIICSSDDDHQATDRDLVLDFSEDHYFSVFEYIIPIQVLCSIIPYELGIDPSKASDPQFHSKIGSKS